LSVGPRPKPAAAALAAGPIDWSTAVVDGSHIVLFKGALTRALAG
jgi:hypothetical protein